jgi:biotin operon repressor
VDTSAVADLHRDVPLAQQILDLLRGGALERAAIADELGKTTGHVGKELTALRERGKVIQVSRGEWGLATQ